MTVSEYASHIKSLRAKTLTMRLEKPSTSLLQLRQTNLTTKGEFGWNRSCHLFHIRVILTDISSVSIMIQGFRRIPVVSMHG